jgi:hypothetical protein
MTGNPAIFHFLPLFGAEAGSTAAGAAFPLEIHCSMLTSRLMPPANEADY